MSWGDCYQEEASKRVRYSKQTNEHNTPRREGLGQHGCKSHTDLQINVHNTNQREQCTIYLPNEKRKRYSELFNNRDCGILTRSFSNKREACSVRWWYAKKEIFLNINNEVKKQSIDCRM
jgi:hypothetical protein